MTVMLLIGDCREQLRSMRSGSVHTCVTSPPYFGLRDYQVKEQIGLEPTPDEFVAAMVEVFREVKRVLRDDGTLWLNLGDSYSVKHVGRRDHGTGEKTSRLGPNKDGIPNGTEIAASGNILVPGMKPKNLIGIPWRVAFALQADGWYLRQDIIWSKPNPMPESVTDRCTKAHEYIFLLSKSPRYYFDSEAIKEPATGRAPGNTKPTKGGQNYIEGVEEHRTAANLHNIGAHDFRNRRSVWNVSTKPFKGAHFATFPPDLIEPCVLAGAPKHTCPHCGTALRQEFVDSFSARTNGKELRTVPASLSSVSLQNGAQPILQQGMLGQCQEITQESMSGMWRTGDSGSQESSAKVLQQNMLESSHGSQSPNHQGMDSYQQRLSSDHDERASCGFEGRLCSGTQGQDGTVDRTLSDGHRGSPPQERGSIGQPIGQSGTNDEGGSRQIGQGETSSRSNNLSLLPNDNLFEQQCPRCSKPLTRDILGKGLVLDPFGGAGTTGLVAERNGRNSVLCELNYEYVGIACERLGDVFGWLPECME